VEKFAFQLNHTAQPWHSVDRQTKLPEGIALQLFWLHYIHFHSGWGFKSVRKNAKINFHLFVSWCSLHCPA